MREVPPVTGDLIAAVQGYLRRSIEPMAYGLATLVHRVAGVEQRLKALPEDLSSLKGDPGRDAPAPDVRAIVDQVVQLIPQPKDGRDGIDGKDAQPVDQEAIVAEVLRRMPAPKDGLDGKDAEPIDVAELVAEVVKAMPTPKDGDHGRDGKDGTPGRDGKDGEPGRDGVRGEKGDPGDPGRDALQIEVLEGIDPYKRYQRGTFAQHCGGIVRSFRATDPLGEGGELEKTGWSVAVNGIAELAIEQGADLRILGVAVKLTSGRVVMHQMTLPFAIYRGVWAEEADYKTGDSVTRDGSTWILIGARQRAAPGAPGVESGWQLAVKKGRDGVKGDRGERGAPGRDGKDTA